VKSPFRTTESGNAIAAFVKDELIPLNKQLQNLVVDVSASRVGVCDSITRGRLNAFESRYVDLSGRFMKAYRKWSDPDELFSGIEAGDPQKAAAMISDYFNTKAAVGEHFGEGFRLIAHIDRIISDRKSTAYNRTTMFLAVLAIVISIIVAVLR
jgi:hypothetical protein